MCVSDRVTSADCLIKDFVEANSFMVVYVVVDTARALACLSDAL